MNSQAQGEGGIPKLGWLAGTVGGLLLVSAGLELLAHQMFGQTDVDTLLWALYVGFWIYVLGVASMLVLSVRWLAEWRRDRAYRKDLSRLSPVEMICRHPAHARPQVLQQNVAPKAPNRSSLETDEGHKVGRRTRVLATIDLEAKAR